MILVVLSNFAYLCHKISEYGVYNITKCKTHLQGKEDAIERTCRDDEC